MTEDVKNADANAPKKLSIQRRTKTTVSSTTAGGKAKAVQVEVRKKRTVPTDAARKAAEAEKLKAQQEAEKKAAEEKARLAAEKAAAEKAKAEKAKVEAEKAVKPAQSAVENPAISEAPTTAKGDLVIEITKNSSWISVKDQNRKVLAQKEYKQGEVLTFNGNDYALIIGAPGNVRITYKGEAYPLTVDGRVAKFKLPKP